MDTLVKESLKVSKFTHIIERNGYKAIYNALNYEVIFLNDRLLSIFKNNAIDLLDEEFIAVLTEKKFLVQEGDEDKEVSRIKSKYFKGVQPNLLYLISTYRCNLKCRYCFEQSLQKPTRSVWDMSAKVARSAIDSFVQYRKLSSESTSIVFYGGEPLLNMDVIVYVCEYLNKLKEKEKIPQKSDITVVSNGTIITPEIAGILKKFDIGVGISIDGPACVTNKNRVFPSGEGAYEYIKRGIWTLKEYEVPFSISYTVAPNSLETLKDNALWIVNEFDIKGLGFNLLLDVPGIMRTEKGYGREATKIMIEIFKELRKAGIYEDRIMRKLQKFVKHQVHPTDCGACGRQLIYTPDNYVGICPAYLSDLRKYFYPAENFNPIENKDFVEWSNRSPFNMPECRSCIAFGICGGGCPCRAEARYGDIWKLDDVFCEHSIQLVEWFIDDLFCQMEDRK